MLVPSWSSSPIRLDWLELVMPSTPTIAATPMPMPNADKMARTRRVRSPSVLVVSRSAARSRDAGIRSGIAALLAGVGDDLAVAQLDLACARGGDARIVGDDHHGGALAVQLG